MFFLFRKKETFDGVYADAEGRFNRKIASRLATLARSKSDLLRVLDSCIADLLDEDVRVELSRKLVSNLLSPSERIALWNRSHDRIWLKTGSLQRNLKLICLLIENLSKYNTMEEYFYKNALREALFLVLDSHQEASVEELCLIYRHTKNRKIWDQIKKRSISLPLALSILARIKSHAAYQLCLSLVKTDEDIRKVPFLSSYRTIYNKKAAQIYKNYL